MKAGYDPFFVVTFVQQLTEVPELRPHDEPDSVRVRCFSVNSGEKLNGLLGLCVHQPAHHLFNGASVASAEKQRAFVVVVAEQSKVYPLLIVYGVKQSFRCAYLSGFFVFGGGRRENLTELVYKSAQQTDKQRVLVLVSGVDCSRGDSGFLRDFVQRRVLKAVRKKLFICRSNNSVVE